MKIPVLYQDKKQCCGCGACAAACPAGAVSMKEDDEGFDYPCIREQLCVGCGRCVRACPVNSHASRPGV